MKNIVSNSIGYYDFSQRPVLSAPSYVVTLVMPTDIIGLIIGKQGSALRDITTKSGARILIQAFEDMPPGSNEREVSISGSIQEIAIAEERILQRLRNRRPKCNDNNIAILENGSCLLKCVIPRNLCGLLIGRGGVGVKEINEKSGAWIKVAHEQDGAPGTSDRTVYITGTFDQVFFAKSMILSRIDVGGPIPSTADETIYPDTLTVEIPCRAAGYLLKKGGSGLKEIMDQTGAHLKISSLSELEIGENMSRVLISGEQIAQRTASELVKQLVDEWLRSQSGLGMDTSLEETSLVIAVPSKAIVAVMEENKRFIKHVQMQSGASMKVLFGSSSTSVTLDHQVVILMGPLCAILVAQELLLDEIRRYCLSGISQDAGEATTRDYYRGAADGYADMTSRPQHTSYPSSMMATPYVGQSGSVTESRSMKAAGPLTTQQSSYTDTLTRDYYHRGPMDIYASDVSRQPLTSHSSTLMGNLYAGQPGSGGGNRRIKVDPPPLLGIPRAYYQPPLVDYIPPSPSGHPTPEQLQLPVQYVLPFGYYPASHMSHSSQESSSLKKLPQQRHSMPK